MTMMILVLMIVITMSVYHNDKEGSGVDADRMSLVVTIMTTTLLSNIYDNGDATPMLSMIMMMVLVLSMTLVLTIMMMMTSVDSGDNIDDPGNDNDDSGVDDDNEN